MSAAGLDHFVGEWLPTDHPLIAMPNVVLTPHIGGATWNTEARQAQMVADGRSPSTEMQLHLACYQAFDDIARVIHSHPVWATMFAIAHQPIPACIDEYVASGTPEVGRNAVKALDGRAAALIANHGLVAVGPRPDKVLQVTALVERTAQIVGGAKALGGPVPIPEEINRNFAGVYGYLRANPM